MPCTHGSLCDLPEMQSCLPPGRPYSVPACVEEAPGQKRKRKGATKLQDFHQWYLATCAWACGAGGRHGAGLGRARPPDLTLVQMPTTLTVAGADERAHPLQVRLGPCMCSKG